MKKLFALVLSCIMLLTMASALAELPEGYPEIIKDANGNPIDLGGMEIIVADWWSGEPAEPSTSEEEATAEFRDWFQKTYNFTIKQTAISGWAENPETFLNFATTGGEENYLFILRPDSLVAPLNSGLFYDLKTLDCLDFTDKKWNFEAVKTLVSDDHIYGMRPSAAEPRYGLFFNKRLVEEAGIDPNSIYDLQANGEWTWAKYEEMLAKCARDTDNDGVVDVYAMADFNMELYWCAVAANGASFFDVDDDGKVYITAGSDAWYEAMNWANDIFFKYEMPTPPDANWDWFYSAFKNGQAAFACIEEYNAQGFLTDMEDDFGFVFFPKGPAADTYKNLVEDNVTVIPACYDADRAWKIAFAYNLYTSPTPGYEDDDNWANYYYNYFSDDRAVDETLAMMRLPEHYVSWPMVGSNNDVFGSGFLWDITGGGITVAEGFETKYPAWQSYVAAANGENQ